jgi:FMN phosphatase YigB (HAD superfamily)
MVKDSLVSDVHGAQTISLGTIWLTPPGTTTFKVLPDLTIHTFAELSDRL